MIIVFHSVFLFALFQKKRLEWPIKKAECESSLKTKQINVLFFPEGISVLVYVCAVYVCDKILVN